MEWTDKQRLDWLQEQLDELQYTGRAIFRMSEHGRGMRLHETTRVGASDNIRTAIDDGIARSAMELLGRQDEDPDES